MGKEKEEQRRRNEREGHAMMTESWMKWVDKLQVTGDERRWEVWGLFVDFHDSPKVAGPGWASWFLETLKERENIEGAGGDYLAAFSGHEIKYSSREEPPAVEVAASTANREVHFSHWMMVRGVSSLSVSGLRSLPTYLSWVTFAARIESLGPFSHFSRVFSHSQKEERERERETDRTWMAERQSNQRDLWLVLKRSTRIH